MKTIKLLIPILFLSVASRAASRDYLGLPIITNYSPADYVGGTENWGVTQDRRGILYVSNVMGVLEFDGQRWRTIELPRHTKVNTLTLGEDGRIYVGAYSDFGFLDVREGGNTRFVSLVDQARLDPQDVGFISFVLTLKDSVVFIGQNSVYRYRDGKLTSEQVGEQITYAFQVGERIFVTLLDKGLYQMGIYDLKLKFVNDWFSHDSVFGVAPYRKNAVLIGSVDGKISIFNPDNRSKRACVPAERFTEIVSKFLKGKHVCCMKKLHDDSLVFCTLDGGLYLFSKEGRFLLHLDKSKGLASNSVYNVFVDSRNNLVVSSDVGVSYVEIGSPYRFIGEKLGVEGLGNVSYLYRTGKGSGRLYLGTFQGLFYHDLDDANSDYHGLEYKSGTWDINSFKGKLLWAGKHGIMEIVHEDLIPVFSHQRALCMHQTRTDPDKLLVGSIDGLHLVHYRDEAWRYSGSISGFSQSVYDMTEDPNGDIWIQTRENNGIIRLKLSEDLTSVEKNTLYTKEHGLPDVADVLVHEGRDRSFFSTTDGIYRYNQSGDRFEPDPSFPDTRGIHTVYIQEIDNGDIWFAAEEMIGVYRKKPDGGYRFEKNALARLKHLVSVGPIKYLDDKNLICSVMNGFMHFNPDHKQVSKLPFLSLIRRVKIEDKIVFDGANMKAQNNTSYSQSTGDKPVFPFHTGQLQFTYAAPFFEGAKNIRFRSILKGFDKDWSAWNKETQRTYTNLPEGKYTFLVKAKNVYDQESPETEYSFSIKPPLYRTVWAYMGFTLLAVFFVVSMVKLYNRRLIMEKMQLEMLVAEKTREIKEASLRDPLTGLRNRRFISEVVEPEINSFIYFSRNMQKEKQRRKTDDPKLMVGIYLLDIDRFKTVNDTYGHRAGDRLLVQLSDIVKNSIREEDFCIRWGGEEFLIVLRNTEPKYIDEFAQTIIKQLAEADYKISEDDKLIVRKSCSIGYVSLPLYDQKLEHLSFEQMIMLADLGLYHSKSNGRNMATRIIPGDNIPTEEEFESFLTSLDYGLKKDYIKLSTIKYDSLDALM